MLHAWKNEENKTNLYLLVSIVAIVMSQDLQKVNPIAVLWSTFQTAATWGTAASLLTRRRILTTPPLLERFSEESRATSGHIRETLQKRSRLLLSHLRDRFPNHDSVRLLLGRFDPDAIMESDRSELVDKGKIVRVAFRRRYYDDDKEQGKPTNGYDDEFKSIEDLTYVLVHLMSHVARREFGHGDRFWDVFRFLAEQAIAAGALGVFSEKYNQGGELRKRACEVSDACIRIQSAWRARCVRLRMHDEWTEFCAPSGRYFREFLESRYGNAISQAVNSAALSIY